MNSHEQAEQNKRNDADLQRRQEEIKAHAIRYEEQRAGKPMDKPEPKPDRPDSNTLFWASCPIWNPPPAPPINTPAPFPAGTPASVTRTEPVAAAEPISTLEDLDSLPPLELWGQDIRANRRD